MQFRELSQSGGGKDTFEQVCQAFKGAFNQRLVPCLYRYTLQIGDDVANYYMHLFVGFWHVGNETAPVSQSPICFISFMGVTTVPKSLAVLRHVSRPLIQNTWKVAPSMLSFMSATSPSQAPRVSCTKGLRLQWILSSVTYIVALSSHIIWWAS